MTSCAGNNTVAALIAGAIDADTARELELHLDACAACRHLVANLGRGLCAIGEERLPRAGDRLGRYAIRRVIGVGGMGVVYEAHDPVLERRVAVKLLRPDFDAGDRLLAEAKAMARLRHANIAVVHDAGVVRDQLYVCMEYVAGSTLREWLRTERPVRDVIDLMIAAGRGLAYVHRARLVHLDFKPDNVLVDRDARAVVTDFGLAAAVGRGHPGVLAGTPAYMAPEQRSGGRTDERTDQYAFCATLREALGERAPSSVRAVIERGMAVDPDARFATLDDVLARLEAALRRPRRRWVGAALVACAAALTAIATVSPRVVTKLVERPVAVRVVERTTPSQAVTREVQARLPSEPAPRPARHAPSAAGDTHGVHELVAIPGAPQPLLAAIAMPSVSPMPVANTASHDPVADDAAADDTGRPFGQLACDDGSERVCGSEPPLCPTTTIPALQAGCWTCADERTCAPLGIPHGCGDGTPLRCSLAQPICGGFQIASVRNGCWRCEDPFTCITYSVKQPIPPPLAPHHLVCGDGTCERGETATSCAIDCCTGSGCGAIARCSNGMCEIGEDHASCPSDCCELADSGSGGCTATCGNGFCEDGEDHASCASDCCVTGSTGTCVPVCGNGFCEQDEVCGSDCG